MSHVRDVLSQGLYPNQSQRAVLLSYIRSNAGRMFEHAGTWSSQSRDRVFSFSFEDLKRDIPGMIRRILDFLGIGIAEDLLQSVCQKYSFERLTGRQRGEEGPTVRNRYMLRKGVSGEWKQHFDSEVAAEFEQHFGAILRQWQYEKSSAWIADLPGHSFGPQPFPLLVAADHYGFDVLLYQDQFHALSRNLPPLDLRQIDAAELGRLQALQLYHQDQTLADAQAWIKNSQPA